MSAVATTSCKSIKDGGGGLLNSMINALLFELHILGYQFRGPGTRLRERLARGDQGINSLDAACREHDIAYSRSNDLTERQVADRILAEKARRRIVARDSTLGESRSHSCLGGDESQDEDRYGYEDEDKDEEKKHDEETSTSNSETRWCIADFANVGRARIINRWSGWRGKGGQRQQSRTTSARGVAASQSRDRRSWTVSCAVQIWKRIISRPVQTWTGHNIEKEKKNVEKTLKIPAGITTNIQLDQLARRMRIPYFRGVFMRDTLPISGAHRNESGIVNLDDAVGHNRVIYFDSFGNLRPPKELVRHFGNSVTTIEYNRTSYQTYDQNICGQMCLQFLQTVDACEFKA